jgi:hypothetical protein
MALLQSFAGQAMKLALAPLAEQRFYAPSTICTKLAEHSTEEPLDLKGNWEV